MSKIRLCFVFACAFAALSFAEETYALGGSKTLSGWKLRVAVKALENSLSKLAAGDGPSYKISKVYSVSQQVVAGVINKYNVDLVNGVNEVKNCNIQIWSREWLPNGKVLTVNCDGESKVEIKYN
ncbi:sarcocystatin-A [Ceratitis capitata]|uniref:(Mediterranean fruit fly) hypothetical protein n=1 Tax=Ceratitis capitata TaxID=7213 RepID=W8C7N4_CERCA|nr:sarcocystatin-A [Ceratitis capitata]CAD6992825.1 unnamed protein product [Ceratitis capitata]